MRHSAVSALLDALAPDSLPKEGMMRIVDGHELADMGRMTLRWLWDVKHGYLPIPPGSSCQRYMLLADRNGQG